MESPLSRIDRHAKAIAQIAERPSITPNEVGQVKAYAELISEQVDVLRDLEQRIAMGFPRKPPSRENGTQHSQRKEEA